MPVFSSMTLNQYPSLSGALFSHLLNEQGWTQRLPKVLPDLMNCMAMNHLLNEVNRLGLAGGVEGGSGCWEGAQGKGRGAGRGCNCAGVFWAVHFAGERAQMTDHTLVPLMYLITLG